MNCFIAIPGEVQLPDLNLTRSRKLDEDAGKKQQVNTGLTLCSDFRAGLDPRPGR